MNSRFSKIFDYDWVANSAIVFLIGTGLIAIYSLSLESEALGLTNFERQLVFLAIGAVFFFVFSSIDYRNWKSYSGLFYVFGIILLVAVLLWGRVIRGTSGWFTIGTFGFQPAEAMKLFLIISLAHYFSRSVQSIVTIKHILVSAIYTLIPVSLAIKQPDLGSAMVMIVIWLGMLFFAGLPKKYTAIILLIGIVFSFFAWNGILKPYQKDRIMTFVNPQKDPLGKGYNVIQSMVAVGSGGIWGKGLGHGSQSRLNFLPEKHTDFIFATIAEESGLVGSFLVLGLFGLLIFRLKTIADKSKDEFGRMLVGGVMVMIFFQILVNVGMNLGIMPVAGLSLPLLSYGGSFLITTLIMLGLVQSVWKKRRKRAMVSVEDE